ncbi:M20/M25/M40 family metallo-hydrolase [Streptomyces sp. N2-109]|uniref:M20/M25/M40 family metallo-hydrolase n=1 Tax=Streptomyces gossypii TaxID=2883101 RepID=A0ABT2JP10_9ACTN|nr:M20/M25/M40 family metallo-hydrolase [Streptomyces gossypii]MCT2589613.1 M20/M25/M40 family metallo-hydrolase [Streptomyces gossypii]
MRAPATGLGRADRDLLLALLEMPTAGPLEENAGRPVQLWEAQGAYAEAAAAVGFTVVRHSAADPALVTGAQVPLAVREAAADPGFLACQPSLLLRLGPELPRERTVMFNVHLDTVAGLGEVGFDGERFTGRGAIDAKGPAVALLAGIRAALETVPGLGTRIGVLIQAVAGEEGGAMGVFGTKPLVEAGHVGRLNVFCEPTGRRVLARSTAAMTAWIRVDGRDAIDDDPGRGHNASVLLGFLAQHLAETLSPQSADGQVCIGGLHTGTMHNKVYGTGHLALNLSYATPRSAQLLETALAEALATGLDTFTRRFADSRDFRVTAAEAAGIVRLEWRKRGLPALAEGEPWAAELLTEGAGLSRWPTAEPSFTCDAIWLEGVPGASAVIYGPGDLGRNNAHAAGEFAELDELEGFARDVVGILAAFGRDREPSGPSHASETVTSADAPNPPQRELP